MSNLLYQWTIRMWAWPQRVPWNIWRWKSSISVRIKCMIPTLIPCIPIISCKINILRLKSLQRVINFFKNCHKYISLTTSMRCLFNRGLSQDNQPNKQELNLIQDLLRIILRMSWTKIWDCWMERSWISSRSYSKHLSRLVIFHTTTFITCMSFILIIDFMLSSYLNA